MRVYRSFVFPCLAAGSLVVACGDDFELPNTSGQPATSSAAATTSGTGSSTGDEPDPGTGRTDGTTAPDTPTSGEPGSSTTDDSGSNGGMCDIYKQDCPNGEKCTAYGPPDTFIPSGIKCTPVPDNPKEFNVECDVGAEGLGDDNCALGSVCLDLDYDGKGFCLPYCTGTPDDPMCEDSEATCVKLFVFYDFGNCFKKCDPLLQNCAAGEGCYMDAIKVGNTGFVCLPVVQEGKGKTYGADCFGWSSCEPGYACVYKDFVPDCGDLCCTPWCDLSEEEDPCSAYDPTMSCVPWYSEGTAPPGFENVGVCAIPQ